MLYGDGYVISYCFPDWLEQEVHSVGKYADSHGIFRRVYDPSNGGYSNWNAIPDFREYITPIADWHGRRYYSVENNRQRNHLEHRQKSVNNHFT